MAWTFMVVLDAGEHAVRCRACLWRSSGHPTLQQAIEAFAGHRCSPIRPPLVGWCACCGRLAVRGLRPANPSMPRAWVRTWVCRDRVACRRRFAWSSG
jgi:hypothetical protein